MNALELCYQILDEYSVPAFTECAKALYGMLNYKFLEVEDIRKADIKEKLPDCTSYKHLFEKENSITRYTDIIIGILQNYIETDNERNIKYFHRAENCAEGLNSPKRLQKLEDIVLVYLSELRELRALVENGKTKKSVLIDEAEFYLYSQDFEIIKYAFNNLNSYTLEKKVFGKESQKTKKLDNEEKKFVFILTVLVFYRVLQMEGEL